MTWTLYMIIHITIIDKPKSTISTMAYAYKVLLSSSLSSSILHLVSQFNPLQVVSHFIVSFELCTVIDPLEHSGKIR